MKKIGVSTVKAFLKENADSGYITHTYSVGDSTFELQIRKSLTTVEKNTFVNRVVNACFDDEGNYLPVNYELVLKATMLQMATNLPVLTLKDERGDDGEALVDLEAMERLYDALDFSSISMDGKNGFNDIDFEMRSLCEDAISDIRNHANHALAVMAEAVTKAAQTIADKVSSLDTSDLVKYAAQLSDATNGLGEGDILKGLLAVHEKETAGEAGDD